MRTVSCGVVMEPINNYIAHDQKGTDSIARSGRGDAEARPIKQSADVYLSKRGQTEVVLDLRNCEDINQLSKAINDYLKLVKTDLQVEIHKETHTPIFKIVRSKDKKVVCEVPPHELLNIAARIRDMVGSFVDQDA